MIKKIVLTVAIVLVSLLLLGAFVLYNFPYETLAERIDSVLRARIGVSFSVSDTRYLFPLRLRLQEVRIVQDDPSFLMEVGEVTLKVRLRRENVVISGTGLHFRNSNVELKGSEFRFSSAVKLFRLNEGINLSHFDSASLRIDRTRIERVFISGFEFSSFVVSDALFILRREAENLAFEQGFIKSELFTSQIEGTLSTETVDVKVVVKPTEKFLRNYSNLRGILDSISEDETIRFSLQGSTKRPTLSLEGETGI
jgi:hypothetical protein